MENRVRDIPVIEQGPAGLSVTMNAPRSGCVVAFLGVWFVGWTFGGISAMRSLFSAGSLLNPASLFLLVWLCGWAFGEVFAALAIAFMLNGREVVTLDGLKLSQRAEVFGWGLTRRHDLAHATNLRPVSGDSSSARDLIAFDYAGKTVRMGTGLNETEARRVCEAIWRFEPRLDPGLSVHAE